MAGGKQVGDSSKLGSQMVTVDILYPWVWVKVSAVCSFVSRKRGSKYTEGKGKREGVLDLTAYLRALCLALRC